MALKTANPEDSDSNEPQEMKIIIDCREYLRNPKLSVEERNVMRDSLYLERAESLSGSYFMSGALASKVQHYCKYRYMLSGTNIFNGPLSTPVRNYYP